MFNVIDNENERIYLIKEFDISKHIKLFEEHIESFIDNDHRNLVFDMRNICMFDSMFLATLLSFRTKLSLGGRALRIINYSDHILKCFKLLHLDDDLLE